MKATNKRKKKHVNHNPQAESIKAVFGEPKAKEHDPKDFKI
ncbi:CPC_1213 family protein [Clostridium uliginosum]